MKNLIRIFSTDKIVRSKFLNALGLQIFRILLAQAAHTVRRKNRTSLEVVKKVKKDGYALITQFLPDDVFKQLVDEYQELKTRTFWQSNCRKDGPNFIYFYKLTDLDKKEFPTICSFLRNDQLTLIFKGLERRDLVLDSPLVVSQFQYLMQGEDDGSIDPECDLHADTFFNTHKAWFYIEDVDLKNGPFVYVPKTNSVFIKDRLKREYKYSLDKRAKGSRRVSKEEMAELELREHVFTVPKNSLLVANTLGYHRRLRGEAGNDRPTLAISVRLNPFKP